MKQETAELISDAFLAMIKEVGIDPKGFAADLMKHFTSKTPTKADLSIATRTFQEFWNNDLLEKLKEGPEPSQQQLAQFLAACKNFAPHMRRLLMEKAKSLRKGGAGGRPRLLAQNNAEARLCVMISEDLASGTERPVAIQNAARRFGVSYWTAARAWKRYQRTTKNPERHRSRRRGN